VDEALKTQALKMVAGDIDERIRKHFAELGREGIGDWLKKGLKGQYPPFRDSEKRHPFHPVYPEIVYANVSRDYSSVTEFLGIVYGRFCSDAVKGMFREAIGDVLASQIRENKLTKQACTDLIYLIGMTGAEESAGSLADFAGTAEPEKVDLYGALANLMQLNPSEVVYDAVERLTDSPNFEEGYLFVVIQILARSRPSDTRKIIGKFEARLKSLRDSATVTGNPKEVKAYLVARADCLSKVSMVAGPEQYGDTILTEV